MRICLLGVSAIRFNFEALFLFRFQPLTPSLSKARARSNAQCLYCTSIFIFCFYSVAFVSGTKNNIHITLARVWERRKEQGKHRISYCIDVATFIHEMPTRMKYIISVFFFLVSLTLPTIHSRFIVVVME